MNNATPKNKYLRSLIVIAVAILLYATYITFEYASQPPLDSYAFRQSQTALTSYWFFDNGFNLRYETPVAGYPWSIPFEFPFYQFLVALISKLFNFPLDPTGRIISYCFLLLTLIPVRGIVKLLQLPRSVFFIFSILFLSSPWYIYWGRSFLIETTALFFSIASIYYFLKFYLCESRTSGVIVLYLICSCLATLQKITTDLPILLSFSIIFLFLEIRSRQSIKSIFTWQVIRRGIIFFAPPVLLGVAWTRYTDFVKSFNTLGQQLTSSALSHWNWGPLSLRFSPDLYQTVVWHRIFDSNLAGILGAAILLISLVSSIKNKFKALILITLGLGILPILLFSQLYLVHEYYLTANLIFFIFATALAIGNLIKSKIGEKAVILILAFFVISNYVIFSENYLKIAEQKFTKSNSRDYLIGKILQRDIPEGGQFVAFGLDWSSTLAYIAERKSFTVPTWTRNFNEIVDSPQNFVEPNKLKAIVACSTKNPSLQHLLSWSQQKNQKWMVGETHECLIAEPETPISIAKVDNINCLGNIDYAEVRTRDGEEIITFLGWATEKKDKNFISGKIILVLHKIGGGDPIYLDTISVPRSEVNSYYAIPDKQDVGFSLLTPNNLPKGQYSVTVGHYASGVLRSCQFGKELTIN